VPSLPIATPGSSPHLGSIFHGGVLLGHHHPWAAIHFPFPTSPFTAEFRSRAGCRESVICPQRRSRPDAPKGPRYVPSSSPSDLPGNSKGCSSAPLGTRDSRCPSSPQRTASTAAFIRGMLTLTRSGLRQSRRVRLIIKQVSLKAHPLRNCRPQAQAGGDEKYEAPRSQRI
jgi:hypothetical protein